MLVAVGLGVVVHAGAQQITNQFGRQDRADAAKRALVLSVQRGIGMLPPTSGQSFGYEFNAALDVPVRSERSGPVSLRTAQTIGRGRWSFRAAVSYFSFSERLGPIDYLFNFDDPATDSSFASIGTELRADVALFNLAIDYGVTQTTEIFGNVPIVVIDAHGDQIYSSDPLSPRKFGFAFSQRALRDDLKSGKLVYGQASFSSLGSSFDDGAHVGVGRISLGHKTVVIRRDPFDVAVSTELFFPSPNENDYAGSESFAILPRVIASWRLTQGLRVHVDTGYDYDTRFDELRRFVWNVGPSYALRRATIDCGVSGSLFNSGIEWTPRAVRGVATGPASGTDTTARALGDTTLETNWIDFLVGAKFWLNDTIAISGAATVPLNDAGVRPHAMGTIAVETHF